MALYWKQWGGGVPSCPTEESLAVCWFKFLPSILEMVGSVLYIKNYLLEILEANGSSLL